jgi:AcrR family transcriptional regulator
MTMIRSNRDPDDTRAKKVAERSPRSERSALDERRRRPDPDQPHLDLVHPDLLHPDLVHPDLVHQDLVHQKPVVQDLGGSGEALRELHEHHAECEHRHIPRRPGRPRSQAAEKAIVEAVLDLLSEGVPYGVLSVEQIAARAGVGKATLYRRWANKESLVVNAMATLFVECPMPSPDDVRPIRDRLIEALHVIATGLRSERSGLVFSAVMAEAIRHPELVRRYQETAIEPRRDVMRAILRSGVASGELRADLDIERAMRMVTAPLVLTLKTEYLGEDVLPAAIDSLITSLVDLALHGLSPR